MRRTESSRSAAFVEVDDLFGSDSYQSYRVPQSFRTMSMSYVEADPWQRVLEEEVVTAAAQVEEQNRSSDLLSNSRSSLDPDPDLTNLNWLLGFSVSGPHHTVASQSSSPEEPAFTDMLQIPSKAAAYRKPDHQCPDEVDYKTNPSVKPPYTYANMIYMAMQASDKPQITLSCIYKWIMDNFSYYRYAEPTWQNSIRHNLSLNKCFVKVPRQQNKRGKGGYWTIDPQHAERLLSGAYKNRYMPPVRINPAFANITVQPESTFVPTGVNTRVNHESNQMLKNMLMETDQDSCSAEGLWISKDTEQEGQSSSTGPPELDPPLTSAWNEDLSVNYGRPLSPVPVDEDLIIHGNHFSVQEVLSDSSEHQEMLESHSSNEGANDDLLIESVLQNAWPGVCEMTCLDLLASSAENMEQLYDFETKIESLL